MRNLVLYFLLFLLVGGCKAEPQGEGKVINASPSEYLRLDQVDKQAVLTEDARSIGSDLQVELRENYYSPAEGTTPYHFRLLINEDGDVDKIILIDGADDAEKTDVIISYLNKLKYEPAVKNGEPVKYAEDMKFEMSEYRIAAEEMPSPVGGMAAIQQKIHYPELAKRAGIEGRVFVRAFIGTNGVVQKTDIIKSPHPILEEPARRAVMDTKFNPGTHQGKPTKVQVIVPILFKLGSK